MAGLDWRWSVWTFPSAGPTAVVQHVRDPLVQPKKRLPVCHPTAHHPAPLSPLCCSSAVAPSTDLLQVRVQPHGLAATAVDAGEAAARLRPQDLLVAVKAVGINFRWGPT